ncbi:MAG TPA: histidinol-phosphatase HisJ family protein [Symbiobacteriaceae bacterium]|nr:histidinol-phosphatase HisJ family protein [Symbiobacteriaceae bacterium]
MLKNLVDYHSHTIRCGHAEGSMEEYVEAAIAAGLQEFGFSDHLPMYWLPGDQPDPTSTMAMSELEDYVVDVLRLRARYPEIPIRLGIEADYIPGREDDLARLLEPYPWDYVLGSVHNIGEWDFDNPTKISRYDDWDIAELYTQFFELELMAIRCGLFDIMTHLDLIKKFGHRPPHDLGSTYAELAGALAGANVAIELSTAGLRKPVREVYPHPSLLRECCRRGVPLVLSSDCHAPGEVAWGFADAAALARQIGWTHTARFERRRRYLIPL